MTFSQIDVYTHRHTRTQSSQMSNGSRRRKTNELDIDEYLRSLSGSLFQIATPS